MKNDIHIASLVVHVQPAELARFKAWANAQPQLELPAASPEGKVVLVTETRDQHAILAEIDRIERQPGVLSCTLVYHEVMSPEEADEMETPA